MHHVCCARSKLIREGQEDYEYFRMAEQKVGRAAVLKAMAPVMTAATKYTHEALDIYDVRLALASLISGQGGADAAAEPRHAAAASPQAFYVSGETGDDSSAGTKTDPWKTLAHARDTVRACRGRGPGGCPRPVSASAAVTVFVLPGTYRFTQPLEFTAADSGTPQAPVTWRALCTPQTASCVRITGAVNVPLSDFKAASNERLPNPLHVVQTDLKVHGLHPRPATRCSRTDYGTYGNMMTSGGNVLQLTHGEEMLQLARWPNLGTPPSSTKSGFADYVTHAGVADTSDKNAVIYAGAEGAAGVGDRPKHWLHADQLALHGYWKVRITHIAKD